MIFSFWHKVPFVRFLIPFVCGISISIFYSCNFIFSFSFFLFALIGFLLAVLFLKKMRFAILNGLLLTATLILFGVSLNLIQNELFQRNHFSKQNSAKYLIVNVNEVAIEKARSYKLHTKVLGFFDSTETQKKCSGNLMLYVAKDSASKQLKYGDILIVKNNLIAEVPPPQNPDEFDYKRYLRFNNIHFQAYLRQNDYQKATLTKTNWLFSWVYNVQYYFKQILAKYIEAKSETAVAQALLYGYDDDIDPDVVQAYANTGTLHVLAVSGMHVGLIFMILTLMLKFMDRTKRTKLLKNIIIILCLWIYSLLCGFSPSILRATVMFTFIILGQLFSRPTNVYNTLAISAFTLMCMDTNMLANVGFQLSYMAVVGIVFLQPYVSEWYEPKSWLGIQIWEITAISIAAQIITFPLGLLYFHQFPNYFLFSNLIIIPLTTLVIYIGIILVVFSKIPIIALWLGKMMYWGIALTNAIVKFVEQMPFSYISGIHISIIQTIFIFIGLAFFISYFILRRTIFFKLGLVMSCLFFGLNAWQQFKNVSQQNIVTYHINNQTAINFIQGNRSTLIMDSMLWADKSKVHFHLQQHFWHCGMKQQQICYTENSWKKILANEKKFILTGEGLPIFSSTDTTNFILIIKNKINLKELLKTFHPLQVIITTSVKPYQAKVIKELLHEKNIPFVCVGDSGAYQTEL
jgi:competence protein ComEC